MKLLVIVATLALTSVGCLVPSLTALDTRLAAVGMAATPYKWGIEGQLRIADERRSKGPSDVARRTMVWASGTSGSHAKTPVVGEMTRASSAVRVPVEQTFVISTSAMPALHRQTLQQALAVMGGTMAADGSSASIIVQSIDCSQRTRLGWRGMTCDVEVGHEGKTLLTLNNGKLERGALRGTIINNDAKKGADEPANNMRFTLLCDSDDDDDEEGKSEANAFALVFAVPSSNDDGSNEHADSHDRNVEFVLRFTRSKATAIASGDADAPSTVVGADGNQVYLLRGSSILSRWVLPFAYGILLLVGIKYGAGFVAKMLEPKPTVSIDSKATGSGAVAPAGKKL